MCCGLFTSAARHESLQNSRSVELRAADAGAAAFWSPQHRFEPELIPLMLLAKRALIKVWTSLVLNPQEIRIRVIKNDFARRESIIHGCGVSLRRMRFRDSSKQAVLHSMRDRQRVPQRPAGAKRKRKRSTGHETTRR